MEKQFDVEHTFAGKFAEEYEKLKKEIQKVSILVMGGSGVGKSTLVNTVFKKEVAKAGAGKPVTRGIDCFENDYLRLYDSEGYESGTANQEHYTALLNDFFAEKNRDVHSAIHLCWYCVSAPSARFTDYDTRIIYTIPHSIPTAVVLTQIDIATKAQVEELKRAIKAQFPKMPVFLATNKEGISANEVDDLDLWSREKLSEALRFSYLSVSNRNLDEKEEAAQTIITQHISAAFATGFSPIPFSDAPLLLANQAGMLTRICSVWDLEYIVKTLIASGLIGSVMSTLGKTIAGNILKWIPGLGTLAGGMINGTVAAALTYALGTATNKLCRTMSEYQLNGKSFDLNSYTSKEMVGILKTAFDYYIASKGTNASK